MFWMNFALISTIAGLSRAGSHFTGKLCDTLDFNWKKQKRNEEERERGREMQSKQMTQKTTFFWWTHWTKSHVSSVSHPKSACPGHLPHTLIPKYVLRAKPCRGQHLKCSKRQESEFNSQQQALRKKSLTTEQNAQMNKHSQLRQRGNSRKQERVIAAYSNNTPDTDTAHHNSSDTVSGWLISQLLCLYQKRWQPSLAFNSTQAPI